MSTPTNPPAKHPPMPEKTKEYYAKIEALLQKHFVPQFPKGFLPTMGERLAFMAGFHAMEEEHTALLQEERARAFEEAAQALTGSQWIHLEVLQDFAAAFCGEAAAARSPGDAEKGE